MFQFCPKCSSSIDKISENLLTCPKCGFNYYNNPKPTNALIAENEHGHLLLAKRAVEPNKGMWDLIGGFVDAGEDLEQSMQREAKEELGTDIKDLKYFRSYPDTYLYQEILYPTLVFVLTGTVDETQIHPQDDIDEIKFFAPDQIPWEELAFASIKKTLKDYLEKR